MSIIQCDQICLTKAGHTLLQNVSFTVAAGEILGLTGPSGSGKTSLLKLINLLHSPSAGTICYNGQNILATNPLQLRREIGYVLQKPYLFAGTVRDNLEYPYTLWKQQPNEAEIMSYLTKVNLPAAVLGKRGSELSGGEQQRVAFIRSLLVKPKVLLLDEITAALDEENTLLLEQLILSEQAAQSITVLFISHNVEQLRRLAKRVLCLEAGCLVFSGETAVFLQQRGGIKHG